MPSSRGSSQPWDWTFICFHLLHCRQILYPLSHQGSPFVAYFMPDGLYLLIPYLYIAPPPLSTGNHYFVLYIWESASFLVYSLAGCHFLALWKISMWQIPEGAFTDIREPQDRLISHNSSYLFKCKLGHDPTILHLAIPLLRLLQSLIFLVIFLSFRVFSCFLWPWHLWRGPVGHLVEYPSIWGQVLFSRG